jgi:hypothetical protein
MEAIQKVAVERCGIQPDKVTAEILGATVDSSQPMEVENNTLTDTVNNEDLYSSWC